MRAQFGFVCDPPVARVQMAGELDLSTRGRLRELLERVHSSGCRRAELDLSDVTFVDASTLAVLHREQHRLLGQGGDFEVVAASRSYQLVARLAGYDVLVAPEPARRPAPSSRIEVPQPSSPPKLAEGVGFG